MCTPGNAIGRVRSRSGFFRCTRPTIAWHRRAKRLGPSVRGVPGVPTSPSLLMPKLFSPCRDPICVPSVSPLSSFLFPLPSPLSSLLVLVVLLSRTQMFSVNIKKIYTGVFIIFNELFVRYVSVATLYQVECLRYIPHGLVLFSTTGTMSIIWTTTFR